jgi:hypothetical protein
MAWGCEVLLLWAGLKSLATSQVSQPHACLPALCCVLFPRPPHGTGTVFAQAPLHVPLLDLTAYTGYTFVLVSAECAVGLASRTGYYVLLLWGGLCTAVFLVKTMKRILYAEARHYGGDSQRHNYLLLGLAMLQLPFAFALGYLPDRGLAPLPVAAA